MKRKQCPSPSLGILRMALLGVVLTVSASVAQTTTYDQFQANRPIDPDKWEGLNFQNFAGATLETVREARGGKLVLSGRVVGGTASDAGHFAGVGLISTEPTEALQLDLRVTGFAATACSTGGPSDAFVLVRTENHLFSDDDGDVLGFIDVTHCTSFGDPKKTLRVTGEVANLGNFTLIVAARFAVRWKTRDSK